MKQIWRADDGAEFDTQTACIEYEAEMKLVRALRQMFHECGRDAAEERYAKWLRSSRTFIPFHGGRNEAR